MSCDKHSDSPFTECLSEYKDNLLSPVAQRLCRIEMMLTIAVRNRHSLLICITRAPYYCSAILRGSHVAALASYLLPDRNGHCYYHCDKARNIASYLDVVIPASRLLIVSLFGQLFVSTSVIGGWHKCYCLKSCLSGNPHGLPFTQQITVDLINLRMELNCLNSIYIDIYRFSFLYNCLNFLYLERCVQEKVTQRHYSQTL